MAGRAFTLLELLIAMAIVIALAGLIAPIGLARLTSAEFEQSRYTLETTLMLARAEAMRSGEPVTVLVGGPAAGPSRLFAGKLGVETSGVGLTEEMKQAPAPGPVMEETDLPGAVRLVFDDPSVEPGKGSESEPASDSKSPAADQTTESTSRAAVVVFLPDGRASGVRPCWMMDGAGSAAAVTINSWTGAVSVARVEVWSEDAPKKPEAVP